MYIKKGRKKKDKKKFIKEKTFTGRTKKGCINCYNGCNFCKPICE